MKVAPKISRSSSEELRSPGANSLWRGFGWAAPVVAALFAAGVVSASPSEESAAGVAQGTSAESVTGQGVDFESDSEVDSDSKGSEASAVSNLARPLGSSDRVKPSQNPVVPNAKVAHLSAKKVVGNEVAGSSVVTKKTVSSSSLAPSTLVKTAVGKTLLVPASAGVPAVEFFRSETSDRLLVRATIKEGEYKISRLHTPERLVVDLLDVPAGKSGKTVSTKDSKTVSQVRFGNYADKTRIVLDLKGNPAGSFSVSHEVALTSDGLAVTLSSSGNLAQAATQALGNSTSDEGSVASRADSSVKVETRGAFADTSYGKSPSAPADAPRVLALSLEQLSDQENMLVAELSSKGSTTLRRTAPSEYVLAIEGGAIDTAAAQTLLAAPGSGDIRSVRPVKQGNDVILRIFTRPEVALKAEVSGRKLVVRSTPLTAGAHALGADARAQAKVEDGGKPSTAPVITATGAKSEGEAKAAGTKTEVKTVEGKSEVAKANGATDEELSPLLTDPQKYTGRLISLDLQDTDIDNALRIIAEVSNLNIIASDDVTGKVTLRLIDVPWDQALDVILKTNGLDKVQEGNVVRIAPVEKLRAEREALKQAEQAREELEPLSVKYIRISYAKASELKPLVETVLSERGTVTFDERTNQLIVKDIHKGVKNVAELVQKIDLRTPQVLLETQIVEAQRSLNRDLGAELGFESVQSAATGNSTGENFPNSIIVGGGNANNSFSNFGVTGAAVDFLFGSADGSFSLNGRLSALEQEGRVRIVSRPAVATTNNKQALIKSVEKVRVKTPSGGVSVATGQGAAASGSSTTATESIEIGISLEVTPQASPDYYILLDLKAKSSTFGSRTVDGIPSEIERSANSTVLVSSGQTFAMGGIYKLVDTDSLEGVPFLKDIPVLGQLFRRQNIKNSDEELLFFVTPRIIEGSFDDAAMKAGS